MITDKTTDPSKGLSPLSELTDDYQNSKITNTSEFSMNEKLFLGKIALFGEDDLFFEKISNKLNISLPTTPNTTANNEKITALWLSKKEWLLVVNPSIDTEEVRSLQNHISDIHALALDVSDRWTAINVSGKKAIDVLSKGTTIDLDNSVFGSGSCAQTTLWTVNVIIYQIDEKPTFDIFVDSTMAKFLWQWLEHSSKEYVYE
tara:strand:- start:127 stop:735 length:609 start_codon:yes stop_codon:yes gene_type:complete